MADETEQETIFPSRNSLEALTAEAKTLLPITKENELISLLQMHRNTLLQVQKQIRGSSTLLEKAL